RMSVRQPGIHGITVRTERRPYRAGHTPTSNRLRRRSPESPQANIAWENDTIQGGEHRLKKRSRFVRVLGVAGLLIGLLAATVAPAAAQADDDDGDVGSRLAPLFSITDPGFLGGTNTIFYPWVANDDDFGLGAADTSISVQNLESV